MERLRLVVLAGTLPVRAQLRDVFRGDPQFELVGEGPTDARGVRLVRGMRPSVVALGVAPPDPQAIETAAAIMAETPTPILAVVAPAQQAPSVGPELLAHGVLEVVGWPSGAGTAAQRTDLLARAKLLARVSVIRHPRGRITRPDEGVYGAQRTAGRRPAMAAPPSPLEIVGIVASTGGPPVLRQLLAELPADFPAAVLVVQHIAAGFMSGLVHWLANSCALPVAVAQPDQVIRPGQVLFAADSRHLVVTDQRRVRLDDSPPRNHLRPSGDLLLHSIAAVYGARAAAVILTGMGADGVDGARAVRQAGGRVLVQDEQTSVVFGMPQAAIHAQVADEVLSPQALGARLRTLAQGGRGEQVPDA
ncbi:MAG: chemotaxis response regulator protein-glutamate methylesterase [Chloroflexi bacterium]|nr:chemotaxis response regulator protein-glutamate methylesterase [Chloroflexota bacterium]